MQRLRCAGVIESAICVHVLFWHPSQNQAMLSPQGAPDQELKEFSFAAEPILWCGGPRSRF